MNKETNLDLILYPRAKIGYFYLSKLIKLLGETNSQIILVYFFNSHELVITDKVLIEKLDFLKIPYIYIEPLNSIKYIKSI